MTRYPRDRAPPNPAVGNAAETPVAERRRAGHRDRRGWHASWSSPGRAKAAWSIITRPGIVATSGERNHMASGDSAFPRTSALWSEELAHRREKVRLILHDR